MSFDKLPDVMVMLHSLLINSTSPVVIYTHCEVRLSVYLVFVSRQHS